MSHQSHLGKINNPLELQTQEWRRATVFIPLRQLFEVTQNEPAAPEIQAAVAGLAGRGIDAPIGVDRHHHVAPAGQRPCQIVVPPMVGSHFVMIRTGPVQGVVYPVIDPDAETGIESSARPVVAVEKNNQRIWPAGSRTPDMRPQLGLHDIRHGGIDGGGQFVFPLHHGQRRGVRGGGRRTGQYRKQQAKKNNEEHSAKGIHQAHPPSMEHHPPAG